MLGIAVQSIFTYLTKNRVLFFIFLIAIVSFLGFGISQLRVSQNIYSILPQGESFQSFNQLLTSNKINNKVVFSLETNKLEEDSINELLIAAHKGISSLSNNQIAGLNYQKEDIEDEIYQYYYSNFPLLIDSSYYQNISNKIDSDSINNSIQNTYNNLLSPGGGFLKKFILNDPLYLTSRYFQKLGKTHQNSQFNIKDGVVYSKDNSSVFLYGDVINNESDNNELLYNNLKLFKQNWNEQHKQNPIDFFGAFQIAAENSIQVKKDSIRTLSITIVSIFFILLIYYKRLLISFYFVLPPLFGGLFALGLIGFIHPTISGISLATGAILIGIALDYSFHFFTHLEHSKSIDETLKDISVPLLTGSVTTVLAFAALLFANSIILQDFGLFATLCLTGTALFTLLGLPIILKCSRFDSKGIPSPPRFFSFPKIERKYYSIAFAVLIFGTAVMFLLSKNVTFDDDLSNLSYHEESLKIKEDKFIGINPDKHKKIYLFASGTNEEKVKEANFNLYQKLNTLKTENLIIDFQSTGDFLLPLSLKEERLKRWNSYWNTKNTSVINELDSVSTSLSFNTSAFNKFKSWLLNKDLNLNSSTDTLLAGLELDNLIDKDKEGLTLITSFVVEKEKANSIKAELLAVNGIQIFDRQDLATSLVESVKDDFNYLLYASAAIVFIVLLMIYGRIELTLLAFSPMIFSWIWILGLANVFDIKFNFVNIIIATIVFGLGDDFSIFITDGLLSKYRYGKNNLSSYKNAIFLSAFTTMIGTGVLFFAKHPAIHSIALISVLGISVILIVSFLIQPILFDFFVQDRIKQGKPPVTFFALLFSIISFTFFVVGCFFTFILLAFVYPLSKKHKQLVINHSLSFLSKLQVHSSLNIKKKFYNKELIDFEKPSIIIANHSSIIDILIVIMLSPKLVIVVKDWVYNSPVFGVLIKKAGYLYSGDHPEENLKKAKELVEKGYSVMIFPEGSRTEDGNLKRFHKGAFLMAQELKLDITPIILHGVREVIQKGDFLINNGIISIKALPRIKYDDKLFGETYQEKTKNISKYYKKEYTLFKDQQENTQFHFNNIFKNYVFKGPILEWYFKVKWRFESKNFEFYDNLIEDRNNIVDVGCGYGYLSYYLYYRNTKRNILGLDYDAEKIEIAKNAYDIGCNVSFDTCDIVNHKFANVDVIFYNDVLHYLSQEEQVQLINKSAAALHANGIIIIRDGVTDLGDRHNKTLKTEKYSTSILKFNKKTRDFNFFSTSFIKDLAEKNGLSYQMVEQTEVTSNVLFILKKV